MFCDTIYIQSNKSLLSASPSLRSSRYTFGERENQLTRRDYTNRECETMDSKSTGMCCPLVSLFLLDSPPMHRLETIDDFSGGLQEEARRQSTTQIRCRNIENNETARKACGRVFRYVGRKDKQEEASD